MDIFKSKLTSLDLFSGIGGIALGLKDYARPAAYCEIDRYPQGVLLSRMETRELPLAPIWDDVTTFDGKQFKGQIDLITAGSPCQNFSVAGDGMGLDGERSGLLYEVFRIVSEVEPTFFFLENVPAVSSRGLDKITAEITKLGYDCRWTTLSAAEVGACHKRDRWFLLAYSKRNGRRAIADFARGPKKERPELQCKNGKACSDDPSTACGNMANSQSLGVERSRPSGFEEPSLSFEEKVFGCDSSTCGAGYWAAEPPICRLVDGCEHRVHQIKSLGNGVVPLQVKTAFEELMGIEENQEKT